jgi:uncharacterized protein with PIN domain
VDPPPAFAADAMLGTLARWLRLVGYDCSYERDIDDERLIELARSRGLVLLTRDRRVAARYPRAIFVPPGDLDDEIFTVCKALSITPPEEPPATRCSVCNGLLVAAERASLVPGAVPALVLDEGREVWRCPNCKRLYWRGTHVDSMIIRLRRLRERLGEAAASTESVKTVK